MSVEIIESSGEVKSLATRAADLKSQALALVVENDEGVKKAAEGLAIIATIKKELEKRRKFFVDPLNEQVKKVNNLFKQYVLPLNEADSVLRRKVAEYRAEVERRKREEEERLRKTAENKRKILEQIRGQEVAVEEIKPVKAEIPPEPPTSVYTDFGAAHVRKVWDFEIVDPDAVPREYMVIDERAIHRAVSAGVREIPGVRIFQKEQLAVRT